MKIYLVAKYFRVPRDAKRTREPGYVTDANNMAWDENVNFVRSVSKKDMRECNVILDIFDQKIIKCSVGELVGQDFNTAFGYYYQNYRSYFDRIFEAAGLTVEEHQDSTDSINMTFEDQQITTESADPPVVDITSGNVAVNS